MAKIEWTEETWNPVTGCDKISAGCKNCYAETMAKRLKGMGQPNYENGFAVTLQPHMLDIPLKRKKPTMYFVNSMSDLFHKDVPFEYIEKVFQVMYEAKQHTFQILTKRPEIMLDFISRSAYLSNLPLENVWLGVSVENQKAADERIPLLLETPAALKFLSCEPLLENITLRLDGCANCNYSGYINTDTPAGIVECRCCVNHLRDETYSKIDWVIVGGESGTKPRLCSIDWIRSIVRQCKMAKVPVFVKQLGSNSIVNYYDEMREDAFNNNENWEPLNWNINDGQPPLDAVVRFPKKNRKGGDISEFPEDLQVRQMPIVRSQN